MCVSALPSQRRNHAKYPAMQSGGGVCSRTDAYSAIPYAGRVAAWGRSWGQSVIFHSRRGSLPAFCGTTHRQCSVRPAKMGFLLRFFRATTWPTCERSLRACATSSQLDLHLSVSVSFLIAAAQLATVVRRKGHRLVPGL